eukprot:gene1268-4355_t
MCALPELWCGAPMRAADLWKQVHQMTGLRPSAAQLQFRRPGSWLPMMANHKELLGPQGLGITASSVFLITPAEVCWLRGGAPEGAPSLKRPALDERGGAAAADAGDAWPQLPAAGAAPGPAPGSEVEGVGRAAAELAGRKAGAAQKPEASDSTVDDSAALRDLLQPCELPEIAHFSPHQPLALLGGQQFVPCAHKGKPLTYEEASCIP